MQPDEARLEDVRAWLSKAEFDLRAAAYEVSSPAEALWCDVMFHAQQAAEKAMKAFLAWHDHPFRKTTTSRNSCEPSAQRHCRSGCASIRIRVEIPLAGEADDPRPEEAAEALAAAQVVYEAILKRLPPDLRA